MKLSALTAIVLAFSSSTLLAETWPQFRGPNSDCNAASQHPLNWSETENIAWRVDVPGEGWSCPIVWDDQVIVSTAVPVSAAAAESTEPEEYHGGGGRRREDLTRVTYQWQLRSYHAKTGSLNWSTNLKQGRPPLPRHSSNTYATETPVTDGNHIYVYFGMIGLFCTDMSGKLIWEKDLGSYEMRAGWGTSSSPILFDGKLFLQVDNDEESFVVALNTATGDEIWRAARDEKSQYSSPIIWRNSLRSELVLGGMHYRSYDPQTGRLLWELDMRKGRSSATPLAVGDRLYVGTEFRNRGGADDGGGYLFAIKPGGSGELTSAAESQFIDWETERAGIQMASPVLCQGHIYLFERRSGVLHCLNARTGAVTYRTRVPGATAFWASPWVEGDKVFATDTDGTTHVLQGGPDFDVITTNEIDELTWSTPAIANKAVYFRTASKLFCIRK